jgi:hypothetical protein
MNVHKEEVVERHSIVVVVVVGRVVVLIQEIDCRKHRVVEKVIHVMKVVFVVVE